MTANEIRNELVLTRERVVQLEQAARQNAPHDVGYHEVAHELAEGWEALERAVEKLDEIVIGLH